MSGQQNYYLKLNIMEILHLKSKALPWLRGSVIGLSQRMFGFYPRSFRVGFMVDRMAVGQVFLRLLQFSLSVPF